MEMRRDVFQAIADPTRRDIISMISQRSQKLNAIAEQFDMSRQAVSLHIKILTECGLVVVNQQGRERWCVAQAGKLKEVDDWLAPFRRLWDERYERLDDVLDELKKDAEASDKDAI